MNGVALLLLMAGAAMMADPVSAQTSGADAVKMLDTDSDGTVDLAECKAAGAATFDKLDTDKSTTLDQDEIGDRAVIQLVEAPIRRMFFQTRPSKADYVAMIVKRFELADPDHEGKLDAKELETEDGQALVKLLH
jgi:hypothetical protein